MSSDDLIRRGAALALFTATDPNKVPGCRYVEHAQDYCGCAERIAAIRSLPAVAREPEAAPRLPACGIVRDRDADTAVAKKAIEDYIAGLRDSHGEPTSDRAEVQIAAGEPLLLEKLGRAKSPSPPTCATCGGSGLVCYDPHIGPDNRMSDCPDCAGGRRAWCDEFGGGTSTATPG